MLKETGEFMGTCHIWITSDKNRDGMITAALLPKFWNKGRPCVSLWIMLFVGERVARKVHISSIYRVLLRRWSVEHSSEVMMRVRAWHVNTKYIEYTSPWTMTPR